MIDAEILKILRCPISGRRLQVASGELVEQANRAIAAKKLENRIGQSVLQPLDAALVDEANEWLLPIRCSIVTMVRDELVPLSQLDERKP